MKIITVKNIYVGEWGIPANTTLEVFGFVNKNPIVSYRVIGQVYLIEGEWELVDGAYPI